jgi:predicted nucleic acid-binding protein
MTGESCVTSKRLFPSKAGKTAPAVDVLIAACARHHRVALEHADSHFDFLLTL